MNTFRLALSVLVGMGYNVYHKYRIIERYIQARCRRTSMLSPEYFTDEIEATYNEYLDTFVRQDFVQLLHNKRLGILCVGRNMGLEAELHMIT